MLADKSIGGDVKDTPMKDRFVTSGASVMGRDHLEKGRNNQDAWAVAMQDDFIALAVADGCSSSPASEVGAHVGARFIVAQAAKVWRKSGIVGHEVVADRLILDLVKEIGTLADKMRMPGDSLSLSIGDQFLFTLIFALMDPQQTSVFGIGDGVLVINGFPQILTGQGIRDPIYPAYSLLDPSDLGGEAVDVRPKLYYQCDTPEIVSIVVGTDGLSQLLEENSAESTQAGRLAGLVADGRHLKAPDKLQKALEEGAQGEESLRDDTTMAAVRAKPS